MPASRAKMLGQVPQKKRKAPAVDAAVPGARRSRNATPPTSRQPFPVESIEDWYIDTHVIMDDDEALEVNCQKYVSELAKLGVESRDGHEHKIRRAFHVLIHDQVNAFHKNYCAYWEKKGRDSQTLESLSSFGRCLKAESRIFRKRDFCPDGSQKNHVPTDFRLRFSMLLLRPFNAKTRKAVLESAAVPTSASTPALALFAEEVGTVLVPIDPAPVVAPFEPSIATSPPEPVALPVVKSANEAALHPLRENKSNRHLVHNVKNLDRQLALTAEAQSAAVAQVSSDLPPQLPRQSKDLQQRHQIREVNSRISTPWHSRTASEAEESADEEDEEEE